MKKIGLISDTHSVIHPKIFDFFKDIDEIWHAGDIGNLATLENIKKFKPLIAVYGNIDGNEIRLDTPKFQVFNCEKIKVIMTHIGGYPGKYAPGILSILKKENPKLFISGHSHILKVMNDPANKLLHINPGAAGNSGLHKLITFLRFKIDSDRIFDLEIMEIKRN